MAIRTINSPGIEITERDLSHYTTGPVGTAVLVTGFAAKGRDYEPILITSRSAWLQQFGEPTTEAERYFFNASMEVINQGGKLYACKLPYKNEALDKFSVKTYTVNVQKLQDLSTIVEYDEKYQIADILAGDYTRFGVGPDGEAEKLKEIFLEAGDIDKAFKRFATAVDNYTVAIPYAFAEDDWMNQINIEGTDQDNWMYTPVQFIYEKLKALFDLGSKFYKGGKIPHTEETAIGYDEWQIGKGGGSGEEQNLGPFDFSALEFDDSSMSPADKVERFVELVLEALGGNPDTVAFRTACDPSSGANLQSILSQYGDTFANSKVLKFYNDNKKRFDALNKVDFDGDDHIFCGLKPYFYCDETKFNIGAYYKAFKDLHEKVETSRSIFENTDVYKIWNKVIDIDDYLDVAEPTLAGIFDKPIEMIGVPPTAYIDPSTPEPDYKWLSGEPDVLKMRLVTKLSSELVTPLDALLQSFADLFASPEYQEAMNKAKEDLYQPTEFAKTVIQYYIDNTLITNSDVKAKLRNSPDLNIFYKKIVDVDGLTSTSDDISTCFEAYNGPESSAPELSSVDALIKAAVTELRYNDLLNYASKFVDTDTYADLSAYAVQQSDTSADLLASLDALKPDMISTVLAYTEIKRADNTVSHYLTINSETSVSLVDLETIDGYATGETPIRTNKIVIVDKTRGTLGKAFTKDENGVQKQIVGIIPVVTTAANALYAQALLETGDSGISKYNAVKTAETLMADPDTMLKEMGTALPFEINSNDAAIPFMSDNAADYTVSQMAAASFPSIHFTAEGLLDRENMKKIGVVVFRAFLDPSEGNKVNYDIVEAYAGELNKEAIDPATNASTFIDTIVNSQSEYIELYSNCFNQTATKELYSKMDLLVVHPQRAGVLGFYDYMTKKNISLTDSIMKSLPLIWEKNEDINEKQIDIVCDAGVSNIAQYIKSVFNGKAGEYDPNSENASIFKLRNKEDTKTWRAVLAMYDNFCKNIRKDCMFVADGPRPFCLVGNKKIVRPSKPSNTIDATILPNLKYITGINTNYGAGYCDWFQKADEFSGDYFWCPPSIQATGVYLNTDINFDYWEAPAGLNRGIVTALDVAFSPTQRQADEIYPKCWNYARNYPNDGIVLEGQRTFQTKESALDRVAARRALLRFERIVYETARWYVYEVNNTYNRQRFYDEVDGIFKTIKAQGGMYDYKIICDESINTDEVIERNEFRVKIGLKLNKFMEFILIEFNILRRGGSWSEML